VEAGRKAAHLAALDVLAPVQFEGLLADTRPVTSPFATKQTRSGDVLILHRYALVWKILYQGIKQLFLLHNCRG
jgi:hypothetical protein